MIEGGEKRNHTNEKKLGGKGMDLTFVSEDKMSKEKETSLW